MKILKSILLTYAVGNVAVLTWRLFKPKKYHTVKRRFG